MLCVEERKHNKSTWIFFDIWSNFEHEKSNHWRFKFDEESNYQWYEYCENKFLKEKNWIEEYHRHYLIKCVNQQNDNHYNIRFKKKKNRNEKERNRNWSLATNVNLWLKIIESWIKHALKTTNENILNNQSTRLKIDES